MFREFQITPADMGVFHLGRHAVLEMHLPECAVVEIDNQRFWAFYPGRSLVQSLGKASPGYFGVLTRRI